MRSTNRHGAPRPQSRALALRIPFSRRSRPTPPVPAPAGRAADRPPTLRCEADERHLDDRGYVVVPGPASADLAWLRGLYDEFGDRLGVAGPVRGNSGPDPSWMQAEAPGPLFRSVVNEARSPERERFQKAMAPFWSRLAGDLFVDHRIVTCSLLTKARGPGSVVPLHQDPNIVDERWYRSVTVWIPLEDVSDRAGNGPLHVLEGSHVVGDDLRGIRITPSFTGDMERLWPTTRPLDMRAGDVAVMDSRLIHGTPPNETESPRLTTAAIAVPSRADLRVLVGAQNCDVEVREVDYGWYRRAVMRDLYDHPPTDRPLLTTLAPPDREAVRRRILAAFAA